MSICTIYIIHIMSSNIKIEHEDNIYMWDKKNNLINVFTLFYYKSDLTFCKFG